MIDHTEVHLIMFRVCK